MMYIKRVFLSGKVTPVVFSCSVLAFVFFAALPVLAQIDNNLPAQGGILPLPSPVGIEDNAPKVAPSIKPPPATDPMAGANVGSVEDTLSWITSGEDDSVPPAKADAKEDLLDFPDLEMPAAQPDFPLPDDVTMQKTQPEIPAKQTPPSPATAIGIIDAKATAGAVLPAPDLSTVDDRLNYLESKLDKMEKQLISRTEFDALKKTVSDLKAKGVTPAAKKAAAPKKKTVAVKAKKVTPEKPKKAWVLRSAKPGEAWISEKGSKEMEIITVGDKLPGLGKVTSVAKDDSGRWVVKATQGTIRQ